MKFQGLILYLLTITCFAQQNSKPSKPTFYNLKIDTAQLFGSWAIDKNSNASFLIDKDKYYIADFDGNPHVPYSINGDSLTVFYEWGTSKSRVSMPNPDLLILFKSNGLKSTFVRFRTNKRD